MKTIKPLILWGLLYASSATEAQIPTLLDSKPIPIDKNHKVEYANPLLSSDGLSLYIVTSFDPFNVGGDLAGQDIWQLSRESIRADWKQPTNLTALNNHENNSVVGIVDSSLFLLNTYSSKNRWKYALAKSTLSEDNTYSDPREVNIKFPFSNDYRNLHMSADGQAIFVSGVLDEKEGKEDLYVYYLNEGAWQGPLSLDSLNSEESEISPFYYPSHEALFFASNRPGSLGDYDIYMAEKKDSWDQWSAPIHLDTSINSQSFDAYLSTYSNGETYYVSSRQSTTSRVYHASMEWREIIEEPEPIIEEPVDSIPTPSTIIAEIEPEPEIKEPAHDPDKFVVQYAVQVLAMPRGRSPKKGFFDHLDQSQIQMTQGKDRLDRYYLGVHDTLPKAIKAMKQLRSKGYEDAFVRPILKYAIL